jgi:hypothetical protein
MFNIFACLQNPNPGISIAGIWPTSITCTLALAADLTSTVTASFPHNLKIQVVERRGRAEGLFAALVKHLIGKTTPSSFDIKVRFAIFAPRGALAWKPGTKGQPDACVHIFRVQWTQRRATLSYHKSTLLPGKRSSTW